MGLCLISQEPRDGNAKTIFATLGLYLRFSAKLKIWQIPACKMEPQSGYIMQLGPPTHQPHRISWKSEAFFKCCAVSPLQWFPPSTKYVRCPPH